MSEKEQELYEEIVDLVIDSLGIVIAESSDPEKNNIDSKLFNSIEKPLKEYLKDKIKNEI